MAVGPLSVIVIVLLPLAWAKPITETYSYSLPVGKGLGSSYQTKGHGHGHMTAIRVWELHSSYITGFQFQYKGNWSAVVGRKSGTALEMELRDGEAIVQISGKWHSSNYIHQVQFVTNMGRFLKAGQPSGYSFNFYPDHPGSQLLLISGRQDGKGISSIGAHWGVIGSKMKASPSTTPTTPPPKSTTPPPKST